MLQAAGYRVHAYTSPHLERFNERIRLAGAIIGDTRLADALHRVERANAGAPITFFEATTAAAFLAMVETRSEEHTSELQSLMRISYAVFCLKKKTNKKKWTHKIMRAHKV